MRHISEILKELGFNASAPESTKLALIKHLRQTLHTEKSTKSEDREAQQLAFDLDGEADVRKTDIQK